MKIKLTKVFFITILFLLSPLFFSLAHARSYVYEEVKVDIEILEDTTMIVEEEMTYKFNGTYRGVFRDITLTDYEDLEFCRENPEYQCGGFNSIEVLEVRGDEGKVLNETEYTVEEYYNEDYAQDRLKIDWMFAPDGNFFNDELFKFTVKYKVYGGVGFFEDYDLFYWNTLFPDRDVNINNAIVNISLPKSMSFQQEDLRVESDYEGMYTYEYKDLTNTLELTKQDIVPYEDFTVIWKLPKGLLKEPAEIIVNTPFLPIDPTYFINGTERKAYNGRIEGVPAGNIEFEARRIGYQTYNESLNLSAGEEREVNIDMSPTLPFTIILMCVMIVNLLGCVGIPGSILWIYMHWRRRGRDVDKPTTVVPIFQPPDDIPPYLLGSLKDEKVDMVDITSTLIDAAYKGYIKIVEISEKSFFKEAEFEFIKKRNFSDLDHVEKKILEDIFSYKDRVTTKSLKNSFYLKIPGIKKEIYKEMVNRGYFNKRPDQVRNKYIGFAILIIIFSLILLTGVSFAVIVFTGVPIGICLPQCALLLLGVAMIPVAFIMPAKTAKGSVIYMKTLGFRMYMHHAERYRVQNLTPKTFEKYLSYAIVFGLEDKWAETFKDIYKGQPDWYQGQGSFSPTTFVHSLNSMSSTTASAMRSTPSSSSGSGWSGGGGFSGGFSGGGGGGGGGGAY
ncbi:DUF2207 domain-containing protein [Candidatus Dojkabacteria bacterium]|nr:DUF2207 domain-containing protein [Candidatus Dojkabacteria bacterium]